MTLCFLQSRGTVEFKMAMGEDKNFLQAISKMVRTANNLTVDALMREKIICSMTVYGLLASYNKASYVPLKYNIHFETKITEVFIGDLEPFSQLFSFVALYALN